MSGIKLPPVNWLGEGQPVPSVAEMRNHLQNFAGEVLALNTPQHTEAEVKPDPWLQQALKQAYEYGKADGLKQRHTEADVQQWVDAFLRCRTNGEFRVKARQILGVPAP